MTPDENVSIEDDENDKGFYIEREETDEEGEED